MTIRAGSVILTGTPHGVGFARTPPIFLKKGDHVVVDVEKLGRLENPVV
jgi:2-keto-4-pentenoate hydratase/2-oxohepta-3-ene-1,7-dioic acid hydratase in catechol pathway